MPKHHDLLLLILFITIPHSKGLNTGLLDKFLQHVCALRALDIFVPVRQFFYNLIHPEYSAVTDVYVLMFLADTVDFIIIVFGFWAFGVCSALLYNLWKLKHNAEAHSLSNYIWPVIYWVCPKCNTVQGCRKTSSYNGACKFVNPLDFLYCCIKMT